jgi:hypothetical protein
MMATFAVNQDADAPILVEFAPMYGRVRQASRGAAPEEIAGKSDQAVGRAMGTIRQIVNRVAGVIKSVEVADRPSRLVLEFGLKLEAEAGAYIAQTSTEAGFRVTLTWEQQGEMRGMAERGRRGRSTGRRG